MIKKRNYSAQADTFRRWWTAAQVGDRRCYYTGESFGHERAVNPYVGILGDLIAEMTDRGAVTLTQQRLKSGTYRYFARKEITSRYQAETLKHNALLLAKKRQRSSYAGR